MLGLVIVSQGRLALEFVAAAERELGCKPFPQLEALVLEREEAIEPARQRLGDAIARVDSGDGAVVLADVFGGFAANLAIEMVGPKLEMIGGINVRTLVKLIRARDAPLRAAVAAARDSGRRHLTSSLDLIGK